MMPTEIIFADKFFPLIKNGKKTTTVRAGKRDYRICSIYDIYNPDKTVHERVYVTCKYCIPFGELTEETAHTDGFSSLDELKKELLQFYPDLTAESPVTVVAFTTDFKEEKE